MPKNLDLIGPFERNSVVQGDCRQLVNALPDESIDVIVTSPPYWGQRASLGMGIESDPRDYLSALVELFSSCRRILKPAGIVWINIGDAYNTPVNWRLEDRKFSSLGADGLGLSENNSAYTKPRAKRQAFIDKETTWLRYGNLLALPQRLTVGLCDAGFLYRGVAIWRKRNAMPEGRCRRPHRQHEDILLFAKEERHHFRTTPPVGSVWEFANEKIDGTAHYSRFPEQLPRRCIEAYGATGSEVVVLDPFSGSGTTSVAASKLGCSHLAFEVDPVQVNASRMRLARVSAQLPLAAG